MTRYPYWPRTFADAFPESCDYACAVTCYRTPIWVRVLLWVLAIAVFAAVLCVWGLV